MGCGLLCHQCVPRCAQALSGGPELSAHLFTGNATSVSPMPGGLAAFSPELLQQQASLLAGGLTPATSGDGRSPMQVRFRVPQVVLLPQSTP